MRRTMRFVGRLVFSLVVQLAYFGGLLFGVAGTLAWPRAWVLLGVVVAATALTMLAVRHDEGLWHERMKPPLQAGQPTADRIVLPSLVISFTVEIACIPLDVFRHRWLPAPGAVVSAAGLVAFAAGWWISALALRANTFAAGAVRYQEERGHRVIDTGPYAVVRHPMYAGGVAIFVGMPL